MRSSRAEEPPIPEIPDVPSIFDYAKTDAQRQLMRFVFSSTEFGRPYVLPPEVPQDRVDVMRKAIADAVHDPELVAEAANIKVDMTYTSRFTSSNSSKNSTKRRRPRSKPSNRCCRTKSKRRHGSPHNCDSAINFGIVAATNGATLRTKTGSAIAVLAAGVALAACAASPPADQAAASAAPATAAAAAATPASQLRDLTPQEKKIDRRRGRAVAAGAWSGEIQMDEVSDRAAVGRGQLLRNRGRQEPLCGL